MKLKNYLEILAITKKSPPCAKIISELCKNPSAYVNVDATLCIECHAILLSSAAIVT